jgi:Ni/Co efflux regulator RcnB
MKLLISLGAVAALALGASPALADSHHGDHGNKGWHSNKHWHGNKGWHGNNGWHGQNPRAHHARYGAGHRFGRTYRYTSYNSLPRTYVRQYHLSPRYRYVYTDGYIYQVDPTTYAVTRILNALTGR